MTALLLPFSKTDKRASDVSLSAGELHLRLDVGGRACSFVGRASATGQSLVGQLTVQEEGDRSVSKIELLHRPRARSLQGVVAYAGKARHASGLAADLGVVLARTEAGQWVGEVDLPHRGIRQWPLVSIVREGNDLRARLPLSTPTKLRLTINDGKATGTLSQGGLRLVLDLERSDSTELRAPARPQHPRAPLPYRTREVVARHAAGHVLAGTLSLPDVELFGPGPYRAAVLISGGGREDRDCTAFGHKPFLVIADHLTRHGIAVLRFDDRGVGSSIVREHTAVGKDATSAQLATDTLAVVRRLRDFPEIDADRIGLIGHSEGGLIAPLAHLTDRRIAFMVLLAGPGLPLRVVMRRQFEAGLRRSGLDEVAMREVSKSFASYQRLLAEGTTGDQVREARDSVTRIVAKKLGEEQAAETTRLLEQFDSAWWRFAFAYDPAGALQKARCPVLALNGALDRNVRHDENLAAIERAVKRGSAAVTVKSYPGLNHAFQPAATGLPAEYAEIETTFSPQALRDIVEWIEKQGARR